MVKSDIREDKHFDMGIATLARMHILLVRINDLRLNGNDGVTIANVLKIIFLELSPFLNKKELVEAERLRNNVISELQKISGAYLRKRINNTEELDSANTKFEQFMRKTMYDNDLYMRKGEDPTFSLGGGT